MEPAVYDPVAPGTGQHARRETPPARVGGRLERRASLAPSRALDRHGHAARTREHVSVQVRPARAAEEIVDERDERRHGAGLGQRRATRKFRPSETGARPGSVEIVVNAAYVVINPNTCWSWIPLTFVRPPLPTTTAVRIRGEAPWRVTWIPTQPTLQVRPSLAEACVRRQTVAPAVVRIAAGGVVGIGDSPQPRLRRGARATRSRRSRCGRPSC